MKCIYLFCGFKLISIEISQELLKLYGGLKIIVEKKIGFYIERETTFCKKIYNIRFT